MEEARHLCREAMARFGTACLDNVSRRQDELDAASMQVIADALMARGGREAFLLGRRIHDRLACR